MNDVQRALDSLKRASTHKDHDNLARFAITTDRAFGTSVANIRKIAKELGRDHALAEKLWRSGWYEARMLAAFVDEPGLVTPAQMDRWARDFDNWAICDHCCFHLFDRTPHAWKKIEHWNDKRAEFVKRAAYALIASLSTHDKKSPDEPFRATLPFIERAASDERNFVKKGVSWALRGIGRRSAALKKDALAVARRLIAAPESSARWIGRDALRDLSKH